MQLNNLDSSLYYYRAGLNYKGTQNSTDVSKIRIGIAKTFQKMGKLDSTIYHAKKAIEVAYNMSYLRGVNEASELLAFAFEKIDPVKSVQYFKLNKATADSLFNQQKTRDIQNFAFRQQLEDREIQKQLDESEIRYQNRLNIYIFSGGISILLIVAFGLWRRSVFKQKAFALLEKRKHDIETEKIKTEETLKTLQTTQAQLIQSEKMASLGELTAGIAHEIQNPLNFVNNFSEVSAELVEEIREARSEKREARAKKQDEKRELPAGEAGARGERRDESEELEDEILEDIKQNLEKITHHGKRADAIVKGMLEHSKTGSGVKEVTDVNTLAKEYLNLAYQSFKSKNQEVEIELITDFDSSLPKIELVRADLGKVLLNILNNAFYACAERQRGASAEQRRSADTSKFDVPASPAGRQNSKFDIPLNHPTVDITTKNLGDSIQISISDNGPGIPDAIKDKIFQPFFTTKPTGQGTGLGLSLAYDIVKAHGGEMTVESHENEGTNFTIKLPIS